MVEMTEDRKQRFRQPASAIVFDDEPEPEEVPESLTAHDRLREAARLLWEGYP